MVKNNSRKQQNLANFRQKHSILCVIHPPSDLKIRKKEVPEVLKQCFNISKQFPTILWKKAKFHQKIHPPAPSCPSPHTHNKGDLWWVKIITIKQVEESKSNQGNLHGEC